jgi:antitoxin Phd
MCGPGAATMRVTRLTDAKASLSSLIDDAVRGAAVVIGYEEWERLSQVPSFGRLLMSAPISANDIPRRNRKSKPSPF